MVLRSLIASFHRNLVQTQIQLRMKNVNYDFISVKTYTLQSILSCDALLLKNAQ